MEKESTFPIIGHQAILNFLKESIKTNNLSHAFLFSGKKSLGKTTTALFFAKILQCESLSKNMIPCENCSACRQINNKVHPDTDILESEESFKIEEAKELQRNLNLGAFSSKYKIAIIVDAERMTFEAQNSLLKILEEPAKNTILILTTSEKGRVLPTIISRCQILEFRAVSTKDMKKAINGIVVQSKEKIDDDLLTEITRVSLGRPGIALQYIKAPENIEQRKEIAEKTMELLGNNNYEKFNFANYLAKNISETKSFLDFWLSWFRDLLLLKENCPDSLINQSFKQSLEKCLEKYNEEKIKTILSEIKMAKIGLETTNINRRLLLENLLLNF